MNEVYLSRTLPHPLTPAGVVSLDSFPVVHVQPLPGQRATHVVMEYPLLLSIFRASLERNGAVSVTKLRAASSWLFAVVCSVCLRHSSFILL